MSSFVLFCDAVDRTQGLLKARKGSTTELHPQPWSLIFKAGQDPEQWGLNLLLSESRVQVLCEQVVRVTPGLKDRDNDGLLKLLFEGLLWQGDP